MTATMFAQTEWNRLSVTGEYGLHTVTEETSNLMDDFSNQVQVDGNYYGLKVRYNFNPIFGLSAVGGYSDYKFDKVDELDYGFSHPYVTDFNYWRAGVDMNINLVQLFQLQNNVFTFITHGGVGHSWMEYNNEYDKNAWNLDFGGTALFKITRWMALELDATTIRNFNENIPEGNYAEGRKFFTTNYSAGLTFYLGKKDKHADWIIPVKSVPVVNNYITNTSPVVTETIKQVEIVKYGEYQSEYVFFDYNKYDINRSSLNALYKVAKELDSHPDYTLTVKSYASPTNSSDEFNLVLSQKRASVVLDKLRAIGVPREKIKLESFGKDMKVENEKTVFDMAQRVELIINR